MLQRPRVAKTAYFRCTGQWPLLLRSVLLRYPIGGVRSVAGCPSVPPPASATERRSLSGRCQRLRRLPAGAQRARRSIDGHSPAGRRRRRRAPRRVLSATPGRGWQNLPEARHESPRRPADSEANVAGVGESAGRTSRGSQFVGGGTHNAQEGDPPNSAKSRELESPWTDGGMAPRSTAVQSPLQSGL